jgi:hypothetical protein
MASQGKIQVSKDYLVFVEACDYFDVEADNEEQAKIEAVEVFKSNTTDAAFQATVMRESEPEEGPVAIEAEGNA